MCQGVRMPVITLTGATGRIGTALRARIPRDGETWRLVDLRPVTDLRPHEEAVTADLSDLEAVTGVVEGSDTVVHLAAVSTEKSFDDICRHNLVATYNVFEAARVTGVRRVVFASTMHVTGYYPWDVTLTPDSPVRPDTLYGVSKAYGEALGRLYADKHGLEVVAIRIGNFVDRPGRPSDLPIWLSHDDAARLFRASLDAEAVQHVALYGVSANTRRVWSDDGWDAIGYRPVDDSERYAGDVPGELTAWQGMEFTERDFGLT